jgi:hypothetical protein
MSAAPLRWTRRVQQAGSAAMERTCCCMRSTATANRLDLLTRHKASVIAIRAVDHVARR